MVANGDVPPDELAPAEVHRERFPESLRDHLPVLVRLREFWEQFLPKRSGSDLSNADLKRALGQWLEWRSPEGLTPEALLDHLESGKVLLVLNGVDEVPQATGDEGSGWNPRAQLLSGLTRACPGWEKRGHRVLLTSRPYGLEPGDVQRLGLTDRPAEELLGEMQQLLVRRWFRVLADTNQAGDAKAEAALSELANQPWVAALVGNPLLLTAICIVYNDGGRLPQDAHDLYDRIIDTVLHGRYREPLAKERARARLCVLAYGMHTGEELGEQRVTPQAQATYVEADRMLKTFQGRSGYTEDAILAPSEIREELLSRSGLFVPRPDKRAAFYQLSFQLSFQEFLAAERLHDVSEGDLAGVFETRAEEPAWRNTLSLLFGRVLATAATAEGRAPDRRQRDPRDEPPDRRRGLPGDSQGQRDPRGRGTPGAIPSGRPPEHAGRRPGS